MARDEPNRILHSRSQVQLIKIYSKTMKSEITSVKSNLYHRERSLLMLSNADIDLDEQFQVYIRNGRKERGLTTIS